VCWQTLGPMKPFAVQLLATLVFFAAVEPVEAASKKRSQSSSVSKSKSKKKKKRAPRPKPEVAKEEAVEEKAKESELSDALASPPSTDEGKESVADRSKAALTPPSTPERITTQLVERMTPEKGHEHRYLFLVGGISGSVGLGLSYWAQGESRRANSLYTATDARRIHDFARMTAASSNVLFTVAAVSILYGVVLELLPRDVATKATMNFHF
jgi:hypothetical protein